MNLIGDALLDDGRLERIDAQIRREFPRFPEKSLLLAYVQEPLEIERNGVITVLRAVVFGVTTQNPRRPRLEKFHKTAMHLSHWRQFESNRDRLVGFEDPALTPYRTLAPQVIDWYETTRDLDGPVLDFDPVPEDAIPHG